MTTLQFIYSSYLQSCIENILDNREISSFLFTQGIFDISILLNYQIGYSSGVIKGGLFNNSLIIPIFDNKGEIINLIGYEILKHPGIQVTALNDSGIFNPWEISESEEIIVPQNPVEALLFMQSGYNNVTFLFGNYDKYLEFFKYCQCKSIITTYCGDHQLFTRLSQSGLIVKQSQINNINIKIMEGVYK